MSWASPPASGTPSQSCSWGDNIPGIALVTDDPRYYYAVAEELKKQGIEFESLSLGDEIPPGTSVVLTSPEEARKLDFPRVIAEGEARLAVSLAVAALRFGPRAPGRVVIGIDPGKRPGIAAVAGNRILLTRELPEPEAVREAVEEIRKAYPGVHRIKCGTGGGVFRDRILKTLQENFELPVYMVDERGTTPVVAGRPGPNVVAAINIAFKEGRPLRTTIKPRPTKGERKTIQKRSRRMSGDITISEELAARVAAGELTLEEAIEVQRGRK
ncbi:MAG: hypothetical protein GXO65_00605 [Euryarchaeota archaeon]|nr:hypothetical protein [Euryarchaeota archaeon]